MLLTAANTSGQVTRADYERALTLGETYDALVSNVPDAAVWAGDTSRFWYRRTTRGGHEFVLVDATTLEKRPPFDRARLAAALSRAGGSRTASELPFGSFHFVDAERAVEVQVDEVWWACTLGAPGARERAVRRRRRVLCAA